MRANNELGRFFFLLKNKLKYSLYMYNFFKELNSEAYTYNSYPNISNVYETFNHANYIYGTN